MSAIAISATRLAALSDRNTLSLHGNNWPEQCFVLQRTGIGLLILHRMTSCTCFASAVPLLNSRRKNLTIQESRVASTRIYLASKRPSRIIPTVLATRAEKASEVEESLMSLVRKLQENSKSRALHRYRQEQPENFTTASDAVAILEQSVQGFGANASRLKSRLPGTWTLVLTDARAVEANAGSITGLGSLPGARCVKVEVELSPNGKARTVETMKVFGGLLDGQNALIGNWRIVGKAGRTLEVTYASALLMGKATVRADSKAVLQTTYCSDRIRVGRSKGGEFYLFLRN